MLGIIPTKKGLFCFKKALLQMLSLVQKCHTNRGEWRFIPESLLPAVFHARGQWPEVQEKRLARHQKGCNSMQNFGEVMHVLLSKK